MAESGQQREGAAASEEELRAAFQISHRKAAKGGTGKKGKTSDKAGTKQSRTQRVRTSDTEDSDSSSEQAGVKVKVKRGRVSSSTGHKTALESEKKIILEKEIKKMEQGHQNFLQEGRAEFYVVKFEDRPPRSLKGEFACVHSSWVHRRNPLRRNGERSGFVSYPHNETEEQVEAYYHHLGVGLMWNVYKVIFCYSTDILHEAKLYLAMRTQLYKEMVRLNGGKPIEKPKPPYKKRKFMMKVLMYELPASSGFSRPSPDRQLYTLYPKAYAQCRV